MRLCAAQALQQAVRLYSSAAAGADAGARSAAEAGAASLRLATLFDTLLKVCLHCACSLSPLHAPWLTTSHCDMSRCYMP